MDPRRLELLLELSRLGSMREVGESMHVTTSTVSQQIAVLALLEIAGSLVKDRQSIDEYRHELDRRCSMLMTEISKINPAVKSNLVV